MFFRTNPPCTFFGADKSFKDCKAVIIPVPYDATLSYRTGARNGPHAIITASTVLEDYDIELKKEIGKELGIFTAFELERNSDSPLGMINQVEEAVQTVLDAKKFPVVLGGEHSITLGFVKALKKTYNEFSVLQIDAHSDLRNEFENSLYSHACVMRRVRDENIASVVQVGIRSISKQEIDYIKKTKIEEYIHYENKFNIKKILSQLKEKVFITIDLDALDPSIMPGVGTPEPGGLSWKQITELLREVAKNRKIIGFDVVELSPIVGENTSEFLAAKLVYKLIGYSFF